MANVYAPSNLLICHASRRSSTSTPPPRRGIGFWMVIASNLVIDLLSVLDLVDISSFRLRHPADHLSVNVDGGIDGSSYYCRPSPRHRLHLAWKCVHHRIDCRDSSCGRPRIRIRSQTRPAFFRPHLRHWLGYLWCCAEHEHAHSREKYVQGLPSRTGYTLNFAYTAVQGLGSGGCLACVEVVLADLVPLPERGTFQGITARYVGAFSYGDRADTYTVCGP